MTSEPVSETNLPPPERTPADTPLFQASSRSLPTGHVLFTDLVGFAKLYTDQQQPLLQQLQDIVLGCNELRRAEGKPLKLPTGDGMALVFFADAESHVRCAAEIARALRRHPEIKLRMGLHSGPVDPFADINANLNVVGGGINYAQRVMDCGDAGHILLTSRVVDDLKDLSWWSESLHDLGEVVVKHGKKLHVYNLYTDEIGNSEIPTKVRNTGPTRKKFVAIGLAILLMLLLIPVVNRILRSSKNESLLLTQSLDSAAVAERTLNYWITVQKYRNGKPYQSQFRLSREINFEEDYRARLTFASPQSGHLYIINEGPAQPASLEQYNLLYPTATTNDGSSAIAANDQVQIPANSWFVFDAEQGAEKIWLVWSTHDVPALEAIKVANPKERGVIRDPAQLKMILEFINRASSAGLKVHVDEEQRQTVMQQPGDTLVGLIKLEHH